MISQEPRKPKLLILQTTTKCNGLCKVCPYPTVYTHRPKHDMSEILWMKILKEIESIEYDGYIGFYLQYEPLTDIHLLRRIQQLNDIGANTIQVTTNGSLLTSSFADRADGLKFMLTVSLLGAGDSYNEMTGFDYKRIRNMIKIMEFKGINIKLNCSIRDLRQRDMIMNDFPVLFEQGRIYFSTPDSRAGFFDIKDLDPDEWCLMENNCSVRDRCVGMQDVLSVFADGSVPFCPQDWVGETLYGNVNESSMIDIFNSRRYREDFDKVVSGVYVNQICKNCARELGFNG